MKVIISILVCFFLIITGTRKTAPNKIVAKYNSVKIIDTLSNIPSTHKTLNGGSYNYELGHSAFKAAN